MKKYGFLELLYGWIGAPSMIGCWVLSGWAYIWSIIIAARESGLIAAAVTAVLPVVSQIYWVFKMVTAHGWDYNYVLVSLGAVFCYIASIITTGLSSTYAEKARHQEHLENINNPPTEVSG